MSAPLQLMPNYLLSMLDPQILCNQWVPCKNKCNSSERSNTT